MIGAGFGGEQGSVCQGHTGLSAVPVDHAEKYYTICKGPLELVRRDVWVCGQCKTRFKVRNNR